ncbi:MAG: hypothetical protein CME70_01835 [Halobacteriovorax sp.]|nr:hypothetical protein [Halobacteriovorax sp.]|tara:strand:+ start:27695 stop:27892 length:198 start_codon:yes stop_codon:yes gene_type:complete
MKIFFITFGAMLTVIFLMAIGAIFNKKVLKGSCGGLGKIMGEDCMFCEKKDECEKDNSENETFDV